MSAQRSKVKSKGKRRVQQRSQHPKSRTQAKSNKMEDDLDVFPNPSISQEKKREQSCLILGKSKNENQFETLSNLTPSSLTPPTSMHTVGDPINVSPNANNATSAVVHSSKDKTRTILNSSGKGASNGNVWALNRRERQKASNTPSQSSTAASTPVNNKYAQAARTGATVAAAAVASNGNSQTPVKASGTSQTKTESQSAPEGKRWADFDDEDSAPEDEASPRTTQAQDVRRFQAPPPNRNVQSGAPPQRRQPEQRQGEDFGGWRTSGGSRSRDRPGWVSHRGRDRDDRPHGRDRGMRRDRDRIPSFGQGYSPRHQGPPYGRHGMGRGRSRGGRSNPPMFRQPPQDDVIQYESDPHDEEERPTNNDMNGNLNTGVPPAARAVLSQSLSPGGSHRIHNGARKGYRVKIRPHTEGHRRTRLESSNLRKALKSGPHDTDDFSRRALISNDSANMRMIIPPKLSAIRRERYKQYMQQLKTKQETDHDQISEFHTLRNQCERRHKALYRQKLQGPPIVSQAEERQYVDPRQVTPHSRVPVLSDQVFDSSDGRITPSGFRAPKGLISGAPKKPQGAAPAPAAPVTLSTPAGGPLPSTQQPPNVSTIIPSPTKTPQETPVQRHVPAPAPRGEPLYLTNAAAQMGAVSMGGIASAVGEQQLPPPAQPQPQPQIENPAPIAYAPPQQRPTHQTHPTMEPTVQESASPMVYGKTPPMTDLNSRLKSYDLLKVDASSRVQGTAGNTHFRSHGSPQQSHGMNVAHGEGKGVRPEVDMRFRQVVHPNNQQVLQATHDPHMYQQLQNRRAEEQRQMYMYQQQLAAQALAQAQAAQAAAQQQQHAQANQYAQPQQMFVTYLPQQQQQMWHQQHPQQQYWQQQWQNQQMQQGEGQPQSQQAYWTGNVQYNPYQG